MVERITGRPLPVKKSPRRAGDPPRLVADTRKIHEVLDWQPRSDDLDKIVRSAYAWEQRLNAAG